MKKRVGSLVALLLFGTSIPLTLWGFWPPGREVREIPLQYPDGQLALPEERILRLEFSPAARAGDSQIMELRIVPAGDADSATDIYAEYAILAEARLDMPLANVRPAGIVSAPLTAGGSATFYWDVSPRVDGAVDGTIWVSLRFVPRSGGEERREAVSAQAVITRPRSVLGRTGSEARVAGAVGLAVGILFGFPILRKKSKGDPHGVSRDV